MTFINVIKTSVIDYLNAAERLHDSQTPQETVQDVVSAPPSPFHNKEDVLKSDLQEIYRLMQEMENPHFLVSYDFYEKLSQKIRKLDHDTDSIETTSDQVKKCHTEALKALAAVNEAVFSEFLKLSYKDQMDIISNSQHLKHEIIVKAAREKVSDSHEGNTFFVNGLCFSRSPACRKLAVLCMDVCPNISHQNDFGATALHAAVLIKDADLARELLEHGADPTLKTNTPVFTPLDLAIEEKNNSCALEILKKTISTSKKNRQTLDEIGDILKQLDSPLSFIDQASLILQLDLKMKQLEHLIPSRMKQEIESQQSHIRNKINEMEKIYVLGYIPASCSNRSDFIDYVLMIKRNPTAYVNLNYQHSLSLSEKDIKNKLLVHYMMDKLKLSSSNYDGFDFKLTLNALEGSLKRLVDNSDSIPNKEIQKAVKQVEEKLTPLVNTCNFFQSLREKEALERELGHATLPIVNANHELNLRINQMKIGEDLLIPAGCPGHGTCILLSKTSEETFRLVHYNTGAGILHHHQSGNAPKFQTYEIIDHIPANSIQNPQAWNDILNFPYSKAKIGDMDPVYTKLRTELGNGGVILPPSQHIEDYDTAQSSGTCAMQCLMAFMRHQVMQLVEGSPSEKEAIYKLIKAYMFLQYYNTNLSTLDDEIKKNATGVIEKITADIATAEIAKDPKTFTGALDEMNKMLAHLGMADAVLELTNRPTKSTMERYATLRAASNTLCAAWLDRPSTFPSDERQEPLLRLAFAKFEHRNAAMRNITERLKNAQKIDLNSLVGELYGIVFATQYHAFALDQAMIYLSDEEAGLNKEPEGTKLFLDLANKRRDRSNADIQAFAKRLNEEGKDALSEWVIAYWTSLAPKNESV